MRKLFLIILIALLAGVGVVALIETDPGYVLISYGNYTLESSLWVGLLALGLFTFVVYLFFRFIRKLLAGQDSLLNWMGSRQARKAARLTDQGLLSFIEGNWAKSRRQLVRGIKGNDTPLVNYLAAARVSYRLNDRDKMHEYLDAATAVENKAGVAVELTQAEIKLQAGEYQKALDALKRSRDNVGRHPYVLEVMAKAYIGLQDWANLAKILPELKKNKALPVDELVNLERMAFSQLLEHSAQTPGDEAANALQAQWQQVPSALKKDREFIHSYVTLLIQCKASAAAEKFILRTLKKDWDTGLVRLYGLLETSDSSKQLGRAEGWLQAHESDAELLLCLGRLAARASLWGKARDYFEASYRLRRDAEICAELGRLLHGMGEEKIGAAYFREGLLLRESSLPELPMPDQAISRSRRLANQGVSEA